jgi:predicted RNA-binding Zn-ribbon protein involved in translation (DUF1610 family)
MKKNYCTYCGEELKKHDDVFLCPFCGDAFTEEDIEYINNLKKER